MHVFKLFTVEFFFREQKHKEHKEEVYFHPFVSVVSVYPCISRLFVQYLRFLPETLFFQSEQIRL